MWATITIVASLFSILLLGSTNYLEQGMKFFFGDPLTFYFRLFFYLSEASQYMTLMTLFFVGSLVFFGFKEFRKYAVFQKAIDRAGLKTAMGENPKVKAIIPTGENRSKVIVETFGVGLGKFEAQKDSLTAGFRQTVESINLASDKGKVEIHLCERDLPNVVGFHELYAHVKEPYSFIIGQSLKGPMVQPIRSLPHLLISGATGGGKSVFFRSTMLSLLKSSPHIQLYLLDLKRGVEVKEFAELPNVKTAKDETEATNILGALVKEMNRRYKFLEDKGLKSIDPMRDKLDLIVVGVDEAAALFGKKSNALASQHIGELARLARAAGIHLIPSTQKPVKEAISTETLDNLPGRMTFRMISSAASNVAMGGNLAKKLPAIKGRAMWTNGSDHQQVQAPYLDDDAMKEELKVLKDEFDNGERKNFQPLLESSNSSKIDNANEDN
ncbi:MAG: DNA translocase FtsK [Pseudobdellovibrionaceae bacterium]|nr:MAG: DNA translocase FtsK [Pseudobdellovibrionaceae bacterium]